MWCRCSCPMSPTTFLTLPWVFALSDHLCWCLYPRPPVAASHFMPGSCWACPAPWLLSSMMIFVVTVCTWFVQVPPICHSETSPHAAWLTESRDGHRDQIPSSPKGKLVAAFSQGSCAYGMAVLILVLSIHLPAALLEWVAIFSGQQPCSAFSNLMAVGFIRRECLSLRLLYLCTLGMMLAKWQSQNLC